MLSVMVAQPDALAMPTSGSGVRTVKDQEYHERDDSTVPPIRFAGRAWRPDDPADVASRARSGDHTAA